MILSTEACAEMLSVSVTHLQRLARAGIIPASKPGREWVFLLEDIVEWLQKRRTFSVVSEPPAPTVQRKRGRPRNTTHLGIS